MKNEKLKVSRAIVVEGRDDVDVVSRACDALIIPTHGFGITKETWELIEKAYKEKGLIILTDPDFSGEEIRKKITARFPDAVQAYLPREKAIRPSDGDIGVENARPEDVIMAIEKAHGVSSVDKGEQGEPVTMELLIQLGLAGGEGSSEKRGRAGALLGTGYGNTKSFLNKLNRFGITRDQLIEAVEKGNI